MSSLEDTFDDEWENDEEISEDWEARNSRNQKRRDRKRYQQLRQRAEDRLARRKLKEQLGYWDYDDLESIEI
ncbi:MAG: hypothetical protein R3208_09955 [Ketobacteraceae bacterium]|nr:hypothetical protein [Ketobacteraceae bacterium]